MTFADLDEAWRYVEMKRAGAATSFDDTPAIDLIAALVEVSQEHVNAARIEAEEQHTETIEEAEQTGATRAREELLGDAEALATEVGVEFLMQALQCAIEREKRQAVEAREAEIHEAQQRSQALLEANARHKRERALDAAARRKARKAARVTLADGGGS